MHKRDMELAYVESNYRNYDPLQLEPSMWGHENIEYLQEKNTLEASSNDR